MVMPKEREIKTFLKGHRKEVQKKIQKEVIKVTWKLITFSCMKYGVTVSYETILSCYVMRKSFFLAFKVKIKKDIKRFSPYLYL